MISTAIPIAIFTAASLASAQPAVMPDVKAITSTPPPVMQLAPASVAAGGQLIAMSADGQASSLSNGGNSVTTSSDGKTVTMSSGKKAMTITSGGKRGKDDLFAGTEKFAQGARESTEINLDPDTIGMMNQHGRTAEIAKKMKYISIRTYEYDKAGMYRMEDVDVFRRKLDDGSWKCPIRVREKNESTDICSRLDSDNETREMVILTAEPAELTFIHMAGQMSLEDLSKAAESMGKAGGALGKAERKF
jgi:hypothetical protein